MIMVSISGPLFVLLVPGRNRKISFGDQASQLVVERHRYAYAYLLGGYLGHFLSVVYFGNWILAVVGAQCSQALVCMSALLANVV